MPQGAAAAEHVGWRVRRFVTMSPVAERARMVQVTIHSNMVNVEPERRFRTSSTAATSSLACSSVSSGGGSRFSAGLEASADEAAVDVPAADADGADAVAAAAASHC